MSKNIYLIILIAVIIVVVLLQCCLTITVQEGFQDSSKVSMFQNINEKVAKNGYSPTLIIDIGAHHGNWTSAVREFWPSPKYILFEAIDYPELDRFKNDEKVKVYKNVVLNDTQKEVDWYQLSNTGDSMFKENTGYFKDVAPIKKMSYPLKNILSDDTFTGQSVFLKIDCQGAEIPILKGMSKNMLSNVDFILLEIPVFGNYNKGTPGFAEHIQYMSSIGYSVYDITELHSISNFTVQADVIFIKDGHPFFNKVQQTLAELK